MEVELKNMPPASTVDKPVTVSFEVGDDRWLAYHNLEIVGWDEKLGGILVRKKTEKVIPDSVPTEVL